MSKIIAAFVVAVSAAAGEKSPDAHQRCVKVFERQRECTQTFIPALVDLRVSLDVPAGIAATAQKNGRASLIEQALEEWKSDSTDAAIGNQCSKMTASAKGAAIFTDATQACVQAKSCDAFVECIIPVMRQQMRR